MSDQTHIITNDKGRFKLDIWETNKGFFLGYVKWAVKVWLPDLGVWETLERCNHPVTSDTAERDGYTALNFQANNYEGGAS